MESLRTKAKCARERRKEREEEAAATMGEYPAPARTSGPTRRSGPTPKNLAPSYPESSGSDPDSPDIRPHAPDIRLLLKARTSGPPACVQHIWAMAHVAVRPLDYIYSPPPMF